MQALPCFIESVLYVSINKFFNSDAAISISVQILEQLVGSVSGMICSFFTTWLWPLDVFQHSTNKTSLVKPNFKDHNHHDC